MGNAQTREVVRGTSTAGQPGSQPVLVNELHLEGVLAYLNGPDVSPALQKELLETAHALLKDDVEGGSARRESNIYSYIKDVMKRVPGPETISKIIETAHPYDNNMNAFYEAIFPGASEITLTFDPQCRTENGCDRVYLYLGPDKTRQFGEILTGSTWPKDPLVIPGDRIYINFTTDGSGVDWGFKITCTGPKPKPAKTDASNNEEKIDDSTVRALARIVVCLLQSQVKTDPTLNEAVLSTFADLLQRAAPGSMSKLNSTVDAALSEFQEYLVSLLGAAAAPTIKKGPAVTAPKPTRQPSGANLPGKASPGAPASPATKPAAGTPASPAKASPTPAPAPAPTPAAAAVVPAAAAPAAATGERWSQVIVLLIALSIARGGQVELMQLIPQLLKGGQKLAIMKYLRNWLNRKQVVSAELCTHNPADFQVAEVVIEWGGVAQVPIISYSLDGSFLYALGKAEDGTRTLFKVGTGLHRTGAGRIQSKREVNKQANKVFVLGPKIALICEDKTISWLDLATLKESGSGAFPETHPLAKSSASIITDNTRLYVVEVKNPDEPRPEGEEAPAAATPAVTGMTVDVLVPEGEGFAVASNTLVPYQTWMKDIAGQPWTNGVELVVQTKNSAKNFRRVHLESFAVTEIERKADAPACQDGITRVYDRVNNVTWMQSPNKLNFAAFPNPGYYRPEPLIADFRRRQRAAFQQPVKDIPANVEDVDMTAASHFIISMLDQYLATRQGVRFRDDTESKTFAANEAFLWDLDRNTFSVGYDMLTRFVDAPQSPENLYYLTVTLTMLQSNMTQCSTFRANPMAYGLNEEMSQKYVDMFYRLIDFQPDAGSSEEIVLACEDVRNTALEILTTVGFNVIFPTEAAQLATFTSLLAERDNLPVGKKALLQGLMLNMSSVLDAMFVPESLQTTRTMLLQVCDQLTAEGAAVFNALPRKLTGISVEDVTKHEPSGLPNPLFMLLLQAQSSLRLVKEAVFDNFKIEYVSKLISNAAGMLRAAGIRPLDYDTAEKDVRNAYADTVNKLFNYYMGELLAPALAFVSKNATATPVASGLAEALGAIVGDFSAFMAAYPPDTSKRAIKEEIIETLHPYLDNTDKDWVIEFPGASQIMVSFDPQCNTEAGCDRWTIFAMDGNQLGQWSGGSGSWPSTPQSFPGPAIRFNFHSDGSNTSWGVKCTAAGETGAEPDCAKLERLVSNCAARCAAALIDVAAIGADTDYRALLRTNLFTAGKLDANDETVSKEGLKLLENLMGNTANGAQLFSAMMGQEETVAAVKDTVPEVHSILRYSLAALLHHKSQTAAALKFLTGDTSKAKAPLTVLGAWEGAQRIAQEFIKANKDRIETLSDKSKSADDVKAAEKSLKERAKVFTDKSAFLVTLTPATQPAVKKTLGLGMLGKQGSSQANARWKQALQATKAVNRWQFWKKAMASGLKPEDNDVNKEVIEQAIKFVSGSEDIQVARLNSILKANTDNAVLRAKGLESLTKMINGKPSIFAAQEILFNLQKVISHDPAGILFQLEGVPRRLSDEVRHAFLRLYASVATLLTQIASTGSYKETWPVASLALNVLGSDISSSRDEVIQTGVLPKVLDYLAGVPLSEDAKGGKAAVVVVGSLVTQLAGNDAKPASLAQLLDSLFGYIETTTANSDANALGASYGRAPYVALTLVQHVLTSVSLDTRAGLVGGDADNKRVKTLARILYNSPSMAVQTTVVRVLRLILPAVKDSALTIDTPAGKKGVIDAFLGLIETGLMFSANPAVVGRGEHTKRHVAYNNCGNHASSIAEEGVMVVRALQISENWKKHVQKALSDGMNGFEGVHGYFTANWTKSPVTAMTAAQGAAFARVSAVLAVLGGIDPVVRMGQRVTVIEENGNKEQGMAIIGRITSDKMIPYLRKTNGGSVGACTNMVPEQEIAPSTNDVITKGELALALITLPSAEDNGSIAALELRNVYTQLRSRATRVAQVVFHNSADLRKKLVESNIVKDLLHSSIGTTLPSEAGLQHTIGLKHIVDTREAENWGVNAEWKPATAGDKDIPPILLPLMASVGGTGYFLEELGLVMDQCVVLNKNVPTVRAPLAIPFKIDTNAKSAGASGGSGGDSGDVDWEPATITGLIIGAQGCGKTSFQHTALGEDGFTVTPTTTLTKFPEGPNRPKHLDFYEFPDNGDAIDQALINKANFVVAIFDRGSEASIDAAVEKMTYVKMSLPEERREKVVMMMVSNFDAHDQHDNFSRAVNFCDMAGLLFQNSGDVNTFMGAVAFSQIMDKLGDIDSERVQNFQRAQDGQAPKKKKAPAADDGTPFLTIGVMGARGVGKTAYIRKIVEHEQDALDRPYEAHETLQSTDFELSPGSGRRVKFYEIPDQVSGDELTNALKECQIIATLVDSTDTESIANGKTRIDALKSGPLSDGSFRTKALVMIFNKMSRANMENKDPNERGPYDSSSDDGSIDSDSDARPSSSKTPVDPWFEANDVKKLCSHSAMDSDNDNSVPAATIGNSLEHLGRFNPEFIAKMEESSSASGSAAGSRRGSVSGGGMKVDDNSPAIWDSAKEIDELEVSGCVAVIENPPKVKDVKERVSYLEGAINTLADKGAAGVLVGGLEDVNAMEAIVKGLLETSVKKTLPVTFLTAMGSHNLVNDVVKKAKGRALWEKLGARPDNCLYATANGAAVSELEKTIEDGNKAAAEKLTAAKEARAKAKEENKDSEKAAAPTVELPSGALDNPNDSSVAYTDIDAINNNTSGAGNQEPPASEDEIFQLYNAHGSETCTPLYFDLSELGSMANERITASIRTSILVHLLTEWPADAPLDVAHIGDPRDVSKFVLGYTARSQPGAYVAGSDVQKANHPLKNFLNTARRLLGSKDGNSMGEPLLNSTVKSLSSNGPNRMAGLIITQEVVVANMGLFATEMARVHDVLVSCLFKTEVAAQRAILCRTLQGLLSHFVASNALPSKESLVPYEACRDSLARMVNDGAPVQQVYVQTMLELVLAAHKVRAKVDPSVGEKKEEKKDEKVDPAVLYRPDPDIISSSLTSDLAESVNIDGLTVGQQNSNISHIRGNKPVRPINSKVAFAYFEIEVLALTDAFFTVGFTYPAENTESGRMLGMAQGAVGFHSDDGAIYVNGSRAGGASSFGVGDVIGCGVLYGDKKVFFTKNGSQVGEAREFDINARNFFPTVAMKSEGQRVKFNFGADAFRFNITTLPAGEVNTGKVGPWWDNAIALDLMCDAILKQDMSIMPEATLDKIFNPAGMTEMVIETPHPYDNNMDKEWCFNCPGATSVTVTFDPRCVTERGFDHLQAFGLPNGENQLGGPWTGSTGEFPSSPVTIQASKVYFRFHSDGSGNEWGIKITVRANMPETQTETKVSAAEVVAKMAGWTYEEDLKLVELCNQVADKKHNESHWEDGGFWTVLQEALPDSPLKEVPKERVKARLALINGFNDLVNKLIGYLDFSGPLDRPTSLVGRICGLRAVLFDALKLRFFVETARMNMWPGGYDEVTVSRVKAARAVERKQIENTLFDQVFQRLRSSHQAMRQSEQAWKINFTGEGSIDAGGPYRESISQMAAELQGEGHLFQLCPNGTFAVGMNRETRIPRPSFTTQKHLDWYKFVGMLIGVALRTKGVLELNLPALVWKGILGRQITVADLEGIDVTTVKTLASLRNIEAEGITAESFGDIFFEVFTTHLSDGSEVELIAGGREKPMTFENRGEYCDLTEQRQLHAYDQQLRAIREGVQLIVCTAAMDALFTIQNLEVLVCGKPKMDVELLKTQTEYDGCSASDDHVQNLWKVLEEYEPREQALFLRFVWGRSRLPISASGFTRRFKIAANHRPDPDSHMPETHTCFFTIDLPRYTTLDILRTRLTYAIINCTAIDADSEAVDRSEWAAA